MDARMTSELDAYRALLRQAEKEAQEHFDKTVLSLSGGALGVSFAFVKDIVGPATPSCSALLFVAWISWGLSATAVLGSFYTGHLALRRALYQIETEESGALYTMRPGGPAAVVTAVLNAVAGSLFLVGVLFMTGFVWANWR
jgi:hypothetical protein